MTTPVTITTAYALTSAQLGLIKTSLESKYGKNVELNEVIDKNVLGGLKLKIGGTVVDGTAQHKLAVITQEMEKSLA